MKILFVSDIHGSATALDAVLHFFSSLRCDLLCIGGDIINYGPRNGLPDGLSPRDVADSLNALSDRIIAVRGNCDSEVDQMLLNFPMMADYALVADGSRRFLITHGHKFLDDNKSPWFKADVIVSGHTHLWDLHRDADGTVHLNTCSPTFPKQGRQPTFAFYDGSSLSVLNTSGETLSSLAL